MTAVGGGVSRRVGGNKERVGVCRVVVVMVEEEELGGLFLGGSVSSFAGRPCNSNKARYPPRP